MPTITVPLTQLRPRLPYILDQISKYFDRCVITRRGKPEAVMLSEEDYEGLMETLEILSERKLVKELRQAQEELKKGKGIPWGKAKKRLGYA